MSTRIHNLNRSLLATLAAEVEAHEASGDFAAARDAREALRDLAAATDRAIAAHTTRRRSRRSWGAAASAV